MASPGKNSHPRAMPSALRLGRVFGIEVAAHWSLLIIFALIAVVLGGGVFPSWHPDWGPMLIWSMALATAVLFFVSIAVHEVSHALVGRRYGVPVERITLFIFGGMAHSTREPPSPKAELLMAGVGPLTSLVIGVVGTIAGVALASTPAAAADPQQLIAGAGPLATLLLWLGPINILLAVFNMMPGFPLDGGRVLRALLWWMTGDLTKATRWSASAGSGFGWFLIGAGLLMALGVHIPFLGTGLLGGVWLMLIGWFLSNAARASYQSVLVRDALDEIPVSAVMRSQVRTVSPQTSIDILVNEYVMNDDQRAYPVMRDGELLGLVALDDVRAVTPERWPHLSVEAIMTPAAALETMAPNEPAFEALMRLGSREVNQIPIVEGRALRGMVRREDIVKWLSLRTDVAA